MLRLPGILSAPGITLHFNVLPVTPQTLCWEERFVSDAAVAVSYEESRCLFQFQARKGRASNKLCHQRTNICRCCQLTGHSCSIPVHINHQWGTENITCRCQAVPTVREPFSSQFPFSQRVRSMNSVFFAMLKAVKAGVSQTPQTLCWEERFVSDTAVAVSYQESRCLFQFQARKGGASNKLCHQRTNICRCWKLTGHSCSIPVHINHQWGTESAHAGVKQ